MSDTQKQIDGLYDRVVQVEREQRELGNRITALIVELGEQAKRVKETGGKDDDR